MVMEKKMIAQEQDDKDFLEAALLLEATSLSAKKPSHNRMIIPSSGNQGGQGDTEGCQGDGQAQQHQGGAGQVYQVREGVRDGEDDREDHAEGRASPPTRRSTPPTSPRGTTPLPGTPGTRRCPAPRVSTTPLWKKLTNPITRKEIEEIPENPKTQVQKYGIEAVKTLVAKFESPKIQVEARPGSLSPTKVYSIGDYPITKPQPYTPPQTASTPVSATSRAGNPSNQSQEHQRMEIEDQDQNKPGSE